MQGTIDDLAEGTVKRDRSLRGQTTAMGNSRGGAESLNSDKRGDDVRFAQSRRGRIAYRVVGSGPPDMFVCPGFLSHLDVLWAEPNLVRFVERLGRFGRVVVYDKAGTGLSDPVDHPATVEERAAELLDVMDDLGTNSGWVIGHSEGAPMACFLAATTPERVDGLVLHGGFPTASPFRLDELVRCGDLSEDAVDRWRWLESELRRLLRSEWGTGRALAVVAPEYGRSSMLRRSVGVVERAMGDPTRVEMQLDSWRLLDVTDILPLISVPTLVTHRTGDGVPIEFGRLFAERIPGARFVQLDGDEHQMWLGDNQRVAEEIEAVVTGTRPHRAPTTTLASVLYTDIVASTERALQLGDEWFAKLELHNDLVRRTLLSFGGTEVKNLGDGFLASFPGPAAAIRCGRAICDGAEQIGFEIRAGVHAGEAERLPDGELAGVALHVGARVMAAADPGQVLVSRTARDLVATDAIRFQPVGSFKLKGLPGSHELFEARLEAVRPSASHGDYGIYDRLLLTVGRRFPRQSRWLNQRLMDRADITTSLQDRA